MKILIAAGGTGGHIYPGIAVANELLRRQPDAEVLFVGTSKGLETRIVPENGFQLSLINSSGLKSVGLLEKAKGLAVLPKSFVEARRLMREFGPDVVIGAGGYVSGPVVLIASFMRIPTLIMDSNALPGFTNRRLARFVDRAALAFEEALPFFGSKGIVTGNPVRKEFFSVEIKQRGDTINILIFGGSQGARAINNAMVDALIPMSHLKEKLRITHQTGDADFDRVKSAYIEAGWDADIRPYISDMVSAIAAADFVICRSGATTCAELAAAGRASIMVPLPTAADDHQRKNAQALQAAGASVTVLQSDLSGVKIAGEIERLASDPGRIVRMSAAAKQLAHSDAAEATVDLIENLARK